MTPILYFQWNVNFRPRCVGQNLTSRRGSDFDNKNQEMLGSGREGSCAREWCLVGLGLWTNCRSEVARARAKWGVFVELRICRRCAFACWRRFASYFSLQANRAFDATREKMAKHIYLIAIVLESCCLLICCESLPCSAGLDCKGFRLEDL